MKRLLSYGSAKNQLRVTVSPVFARDHIRELTKVMEAVNLIMSQVPQQL